VPRKLNIGILGCGFMAKIHANAYKKIGYVFSASLVEPELRMVYSRNESAVKRTAERFNFQKWTTNWKDIINDDIDIFDNTGSNDTHYEPTLLALKAGKHVIVEKPLAVNLQEAREMYDASQEAQKNGIKSMVAFNYRFIPALRLVKRIINEGRLGKIYQFRSNFLQDKMADPTVPFSWRLDKEKAGSFALGDLNSHAIDILRFLLQAEVDSVMGYQKTFNTKRPDQNGKQLSVDVDETSLLWLEMENGVLATLESSKVSTGYKAMWRIEIHGSEGGIYFDLTRANELQFYSKADPLYLQGMKVINVTEPEAHELFEDWLPRGHGIGWEYYHLYMLEHFLRSIVMGTDIGPQGATFYDGLKCQQVIEAAIMSFEKGTWIKIKDILE